MSPVGNEFPPKGYKCAFSPSGKVQQPDQLLQVLLSAKQILGLDRSIWMTNQGLV